MKKFLLKTVTSKAVCYNLQGALSGEQLKGERETQTGKVLVETGVKCTQIKSHLRAQFLLPVLGIPMSLH